MAWGHDIPDRSILYIINMTATLLSLFGSIWMTYFCLKVSGTQPLSSKLVLGIALSDLFYSITNIMSIFEAQDKNIIDDMCRVEAIVRFYSLKLTLFFSTLIAIACYTASSKGNVNSKTFIKKSVLVGGSLFGAFTLG